MFIPGIVQALVAALTFGIVLNAASAAVFLFAKGHGSKIFRDGLRLVLITFLASAALWAQIDFAALTIDPTATSGCQVAVIFTTIFDQLARFAIEQYLLWAINSNAKAPTGAIIPQAVIGTRFVLGAVFVGFQKPQIATVCVSKTDVLPIGVVIMVTDFLIIGMLAFRASSLGLIAEAKSGQAGAQGKKAVLWIMGGHGAWTAGSIPMLLGAESIELIFRTALPATALSLLVGIITGFSDSLLPPRPQQITHPDAQSPRNISSSRDLGTSDSDYPPTRYEDLKAGTITTVTTFGQPREAPRPEIQAGAGGSLPIIAGSVPGQAAIGVGGVPVQGQLFPPIRAQTAPVREGRRLENAPKPQYKRSIFDRGGPGASIKNAISNPILLESGERNPLNKIATIDLATAAQNDREKRDNDMATMQRLPSLIAQRPAPQPPAITPEEALKRAQSMKRKEWARSTTTTNDDGFAIQPQSDDDATSSQGSNAVQNIIQGAVNQAAKTPLGLQSPGSALKSSGSVVHRPRPIPRQQGKDRSVFPAEDTPNHKRSKSGGSIISRKSILLSNPGSPTQLPPLPPPPKSAGNPIRPLPNDTKSMTFDEKMDLFFPRPPSSSDAGSKARESVPEMPVLPAAYKIENNAMVEGKGGWDTDSSRVQSKMSSDISTKTSVRTQSILDIDEPQHPLNYPRNTSKFSVDTSIVTGRGLAEDRDSWIPDLPVHERAQGISYDGAKRQSSPVLPTRNPSLSEFSESRTHDEVATTNWGSIHSPVAAVNLQDVTHMPKPTWIQPRDVSMISHGDGKEVIDIMLDASVEHERDFVPSIQDGPADLSDMSVANRGARWHRRIGDECVTFSERKEKVNSRRMPPPTPLQLKSPSRRMNAVVLQVAEPSPLESPQHAYEMIQAQLKKLEEPNRDSYESQGQRIRLLESLEAEMGQQENQWHEMQHGLSRDSFSTNGTTSVRNSQQEPSNVSVHSRDSSLHSNIAADRRASRRARMQSGVSLNKSSYEDLRSAASSSSSNDNRTSLWQRRLNDAQMEYMENATELLAKRNLNFLSVSKARVSAQLGSPTPPDTDESEGVDAQILATLMPKERAAPEGHLWAPVSPLSSEREPALLWAPTHDVASEPTQSGQAAVVLPGLSVRPAARKTSEPLVIESFQLWQSDHTAAKKLRISFTKSLWRASFVAEPPKTQARPLTQRPPRRSKRITALPDILENPEPLPDKRGTLGIFQFPWGEKSDTATVQPRPRQMFMAMPGTMSTGGSAVRAALEARAQQLQAQEYSSSFFDDYDEEEEGDDEVSDIDEDDESDDGFDETTLWEIASLLQSDQVPSKNSLLPQPQYYRPDSLVEDEYVSQGSSEYPSEDEKTANDEDDTKHDSMVITVAAEEVRSSPETSSLLWTGKPKRFVSVRLPPGLPQPDARTWTAYMDTMNAPPRIQTQLLEPAIIRSNNLWIAPLKLVETPNSGTLWTRSQLKTMATPVTKPQTMKSLWAASPTIVETEATGLFNIDYKRITFRTTSASPVGLTVSSTARVIVEALPTLTSNSLWTSPRTPAKSLWNAPAVIVEVVYEGLFDAGHKRATFKTTSALPIGVSMSSTARWQEALNEAIAASAYPVEAPFEQEVEQPRFVEQFNFDQQPYAEQPEFEQQPYYEQQQLEQQAYEQQQFEQQEYERRLYEQQQYEQRLFEQQQYNQRLLEQQMYQQQQYYQQQQFEPQFDPQYDEQYEQPAEPQFEQRAEPEIFLQPTQYVQPAREADTESEYDPEPEFEPAPSPLPMSTTTTSLWSAPEVTTPEENRNMWTLPAKPFRHSFDATPLTPEDSESRELRLKRTKAQTRATGLVSFEGHSMWTQSAPTTPIVPMWSAPKVIIPKDNGIMWIAPTKPALHAYDSAPLTPEDSESRYLRLKRTQTRSAPDAVSFAGHSMWNRFYGEELQRVVPLGGGHNWIAGAPSKPAS
ncbi:hypothetical protein K4K60_001666 [Colletotrichum sp. SAR11_57]|nr:hypothetical protein K4K60_001666 [Colletotrichum sp. SAR11_57]